MKSSRLGVFYWLISGLALLGYAEEAASRGTFVFDPRHRTWTAIDSDGQIVGRGRASGGRNYCPDVHRRCHTPVGRFTMYHKGPVHCISKKFPVGRGGAKMPYCMFFHGGYAVHGSYEVPNYNASHGCIRLPPADARWLYDNFMSTGTTVIVKPY